MLLGFGSRSHKMGSSTRETREMLEHLSKATTPEEFAPKHKHVRGIINYLHESPITDSFWVTGLNEPSLVINDVRSFKSMITIHKALLSVEGKGNVVKDAYRSLNSSDNFWSRIGSMYSHKNSGYSELVLFYYQFIKRKVELHYSYPACTVQFSFKYFIDCVIDPNKTVNAGFSAEPNSANCNGRIIIPVLLDLLQSLMNLKEKLVNQRRGGGEELKRAPFVAIVEESKYIYEFLKELVDSMHATDEPCPELPQFVRSFNQTHAQLLQFYEDCRNLQLLSRDDLDLIPKLSDYPPSFQPFSSRPRPAPKRQPSSSSVPQVITQVVPSDPLLLEKLRQAELKAQQGEHNAQQIRHLEEELNRLRMQLQQKEQNEMNLARERDIMAQKDKGIQDTQAQYAQEYNRIKAQFEAAIKERDDRAKSLQDESEKWKNYYEAAKKSYLQIKSIMDTSESSRQGQYEKIQADMFETQKRELLALKERLDAQHKEEINRLNAENRIKTGQADKMEAMNEELRKQLNELRGKLSSLEDTARKSTLDAGKEADLLAKLRSKDDEIRNLTSQMEKALALAKSQQAAAPQPNDLLLKLLDSVLDGSRRKIADAVSDLTNPDALGNQTATPEFTLTSAENVQRGAQDLATTMERFLRDMSSSRGVQPDEVIGAVGEVTSMIDQLLANSKGLTRLSSLDDEMTNGILTSAKNTGKAALTYVASLKSASLAGYPTTTDKINSVQNQYREFQNQLQNVVKQTEKLLPKVLGDADLEKSVEDGMLKAAQEIQEAMERLRRLREQPANSSSLTVPTVHGSLLDAAMVITTAIANLIKKATDTQHEIVAYGKGGSTPAAFYKKNNRWTEGLISAAKAVAMSTSILVESADGLVSGREKLEQLVVASHEVASATVQIVTASRVKKIPNSKCQEPLEDAAQRVKDATKSLVAIAQDVSKIEYEMAQKRKEEEERQMVDFGKMKISNTQATAMNLQVKILEQEKALEMARREYSTFKKANYNAGEDATTSK